MFLKEKLAATMTIVRTLVFKIFEPAHMIKNENLLLYKPVSSVNFCPEHLVISKSLGCRQKTVTQRLQKGIMSEKLR